MAESDPEHVRAILAFIRDHPGVPYHEIEREFHYVYQKIVVSLGYLAEMRLIAYHVEDRFDEKRGTIAVLYLYLRRSV